MSARAAAAKARAADPLRRDVDAELVRHLYRQASVGQFGMIAGSCLLTYVLWDAFDRQRLLYWLAGHSIASVLRLVLIAAYFRRAPPPAAAPRWAAASAVGSLVSGCLWASACALFFDPAQPLSMVTITVILVALSGGSAAIQGAYLPSFWAFVGPALGTLVAVALWHGGVESNVVALIATAAVLAYYAAARNTMRLHADSFRLGYENVVLRREAEEKTRLLEATLENMRQGISLADAQGRLRMWNSRFLDLVGLAAADVAEGRPMPAVLARSQPPLVLDGAHRLEHRRGDGAVVEVTNNAMPDGGCVVTYTDITDLKRRETALDAARRGAEQANAAKTRFLAAASHDLRQPIHALGLLVATLADHARDGETAPLFEQIDDAIQAVDSMLIGLLDISKLDAGVVQPTIGPVDVGALLQRLGSEQQPIAEVTGNRLRVRAPRAYGVSDPAMLHRILANLISNALRYTRAGRVLVGTRRRGNSIRIDVCDAGPGIPPESLDEIFLEFHQLGNPERDRRKGLGLGLAIVKRLASLLGHRVEVRSVVGRGSRFSLTLPRTDEPPRPAPQRGPAVPRGNDVAGRRVLLLDDEVSVLAAMRRLLERWGCEVIAAATPEEAEALLASGPALPDLLIVDYRLRGNASGIETVGRLHRLAGAPIPALIVTGDTAPDRLQEAQASGYLLLHKPVMPEELRAAVRELMRGATKG